mmetsp:Transcript_33472/g.56899  ORF Transcript_33472/g.56899 Transcript_33472/m.56899 type:complete len:232 (-) Transcript_33472:332-1027(-)
MVSTSTSHSVWFSAFSCCMSPNWTSNSSLSRSSCCLSSCREVNSSRSSFRFSALSSSSSSLMRASKASFSTEVKAPSGDTLSIVASLFEFVREESSVIRCMSACDSSFNSSLSFLRDAFSSAKRSGVSNDASKSFSSSCALVSLRLCNCSFNFVKVCSVCALDSMELSMLERNSSHSCCKSLVCSSAALALASNDWVICAFSCIRHRFLSNSSLWRRAIESISSCMSARFF